VRFQDLWGGSSVQYEPDVAVMLNRGDENEIAMAVEKNRMGPTRQSLLYKLLPSVFAFQLNITRELAE
jgi:hypothetical protein